MKKSILLATLIALAGGTAVAAPAPAAAGASPPADARHAAPRVPRHGAHGNPVAHMLMQNLMAEELAASTGKPAAEVRQLMQDLKPRALMRELGVDREQMHSARQRSQATLIERLAGAGLLTAEQATMVRMQMAKRAQGHPPRAPE